MKELDRFSPYLSTYFLELARAGMTIDPSFSEVVSFATRVIFSIDINISNPFPSIYGIGHPSSIVIGGLAQCGNNLFFNHGVTIGRFRDDRPTIGNNVLLMPNTTIVGRTSVGDNSVISAGITLINIEIPPYSLVKLDTTGRLLVLPSKKDYLSAYFFSNYS